MIIFFIYKYYTSKSFYLEVNPNETIIEILKKNGLINLENLRKEYDFRCHEISSFDDFLQKTVYGYDLFKSLNDNNIKEYSVLEYNPEPFLFAGGVL